MVVRQHHTLCADLKAPCDDLARKDRRLVDRAATDAFVVHDLVPGIEIERSYLLLAQRLEAQLQIIEQLTEIGDHASAGERAALHLDRGGADELELADRRSVEFLREQGRVGGEDVAERADPAQ